MWCHSDTLSWFWPNQSFLIFLNTACLEEKQQIPISFSLIWPNWVSNPQSIAPEASTLTITPPMQSIGDRVMAFNATFNNISVISWQSVLLVEETGVSEENHQPLASHWQTLSHNVLLSTPCLSRIRTYNFSGDRHLLHR